MTKISNEERILIIEDDVLFCKTLINALKREGFTAEGAKDGTEALKLVQKESFNIIVSDIRLPGEMDGIETLQKIKSINTYPMKIILMTGYADKEAPVKAIKLGVVEYLFKPFELEGFLTAVKKCVQTFRIEENAHQEFSNRDELTGLFNHRYFYEIIDRETKRSARYKHPLTLFMIDIDNFKEFNDQHGYLNGDVVLKKLAEIFLENLRSVDLVFRYGGEEFAVLLPESDKTASIVVAERLIQETAMADIKVMDEKSFKFTISIGLSQFLEDSTGKSEFITNAELALREAKKDGKNQVVVSENNK